jgi:hypothetical protein
MLLAQYPPLLSSSLTPNDFIRMHNLPPILHRLAEVDLVELACACQARDLLQQQMCTARIRYNYMQHVLKSFQLECQHIEQELRTSSDSVDFMVNDAVNAATTLWPPANHNRADTGSPH